MICCYLIYLGDCTFIQQIYQMIKASKKPYKRKSEHQLRIPFDADLFTTMSFSFEDF